MTASAHGSTAVREQGTQWQRDISTPPRPSSGRRSQPGEVAQRRIKTAPPPSSHAGLPSTARHAIGGAAATASISVGYGSSSRPRWLASSMPLCTLRSHSHAPARLSLPALITAHSIPLRLSPRFTHGLAGYTSTITLPAISRTTFHPDAPAPARSHTSATRGDHPSESCLFHQPGSLSHACDTLALAKTLSLLSLAREKHIPRARPSVVDPPHPIPRICPFHTASLTPARR